MRRLLPVVLIVAAALGGRLIDARRLAGDIKGDESTYIAMAFSLARDGDLRYEARDYQRFVGLYGHGPSGIFLKRRYALGLHGKTPVPSTDSLAFGKALAYPMAAAPFVVLGGLGGLLVFNWVLLGLCLYCAARFCGALVGRGAGWFVAAVFLGASVVPVYAAWLTSETFNFSVILIAYFLWLYKRVVPAETRSWLMRPETTIAAALLIGVATFSKGTNAALIGPIVLEALWSRRLVRSIGLVLAFVIAAAGLFGLNALITGEANYQGAADGVSRRYFVEHYPFDEAGTQFDERGSAMITNDADTGRVLADEALAQVPVNTWYFLVGRHAGLVPYYLPGMVMALLWLSRARRAPVWQWGTALAVAGSVSALIVFFPDSWNGGGGPPGNRYFLSLYAPLLFLAPAGLSLWPSVLALVGGVAFTGAMVLHPYEASSKVWLNPERKPLNWLPIELTLVNDLPCKINPLRCPITFIAEPTVQFYYMDGRTYSAERSPGSQTVDGTWIAGGASTDILVKTDLPPSRVRIEFSGPIENDVRGTFGDRPFAAHVPAGGRSAVTVSRPTPFRYHQNSVYVLHLETARGFVPAQRDAGSKDARNLGVFIRPTFDYDEASRDAAGAR
jgi:hypothetical protein